MRSLFTRTFGKWVLVAMATAFVAMLAAAVVVRHELLWSLVPQKLLFYVVEAWNPISQEEVADAEFVAIWLCCFAALLVALPVCLAGVRLLFGRHEQNAA
ncbi:hypothetical protein [Piscinibacter gummiphilus]|uniref:hypothetical protein n=1 Tax=Piscinibacter gummiphilus TaxID=946333 RepID=UPI0012F4D753|nr:hypothetical protein [Piscinibacter gummiphilus]